MSQLSLFISTVTSEPSFAIADRDLKIVYTSKISRPEKADSLPKHFNQAMKSSDIDILQISRLFIVTGPGSFTGIRSGIAFAFGVSSLMQMELIKITSFDLMHAGFWTKGILSDGNIKHYKNRSIGTLIPFRPNEFFCRIVSGGKVSFEGIVKKEDLLLGTHNIDIHIFSELHKDDDLWKTNRCLEIKIDATLMVDVFKLLDTESQSDSGQQSNIQFLNQALGIQRGVAKTIEPYYNAEPSINPGCKKMLK
jgi:hypothetical protein